jgi:hypothetical protein
MYGNKLREALNNEAEQNRAQWATLPEANVRAECRGDPITELHLVGDVLVEGHHSVQELVELTY